MPTLHPLGTLQHGEYSRHVTLVPMKWQNDATNKLQDFFGIIKQTFLNQVMKYEYLHQRKRESLNIT